MTPDRPLPPVFLPCENKAREFDAKLLLAGILAERGHVVYVGSRNLMHLALARLPRGIYLGKDVRHSSRHVARLLRLLGQRFVAMDEEGLIYYSRADYVRLRVHPQVLAAAEKLLAWGPDNAQAWREASCYDGTPIVETGNGRMDLLRPDFMGLHQREAEAIRARHGRFVLINTNFGSLNHFFKNLTPLAPPEKLGEAADPWQAELSRHRYAVFNAFTALVPQLAKAFPERHFIIRPHPSENHEVWQKAAGGAANVAVINQGSVVAWLLACDSLIHNSCTTGIEAYLLNRRALAYLPVRSARFDLHLANDLGIAAESADQVIGLLREGFATGEAAAARSPAREAVIARHISNTGGRLASEAIADELEGLASPRGSRVLRPLGMAYAEARALIKRRNAHRTGHKSNIAYTHHRFPPTPLAEASQRLRDIGLGLRRFQGLRVTAYAPDVFIVTRQ